MACRDKSTTYLKNLGYNVVRHPRTGIAPLGVAGRRGDSVSYLGHLQYLLQDPPNEFPEIQTDDAANVNGRQSDKLDLGVGLNILGNIIGAMGGNLGLSASYTNAKNIQFTFTDVILDSIPLLVLGSYIKDKKIDTANPFVEPYVKDGELFLITRTIKSNKITVNYEQENGISAKVDVPVIKEMVGGNVKVEKSSASGSAVMFEGNAQLVFGFAAYNVSTNKTDGTMALRPQEPGAGFLGADDSEKEPKPAELSPAALLDF